MNYPRLIALRTYPHRCDICSDEGSRPLETHHRDLNRKNNAPENLRLLCRSCHRSLHARIRWDAEQAVHRVTLAAILKRVPPKSEADIQYEKDMADWRRDLRSGRRDIGPHPIRAFLKYQRELAAAS